MRKHLNRRIYLTIIGAFTFVAFFAGLVPRVAAGVPTVHELSIMSRREFARRAKRITANMTPAQVEAVLGKPDFIGHFYWPKNTVFWFYGCIGPRKLPTLGEVGFVDTGGVIKHPVVVARQPVGSLSDADARRALLLLDDMAYEEANPAVTVRLANAMLPLGKKNILATIAEYEDIGNTFERPDFSTEWKQPGPTIEGLRKQWYWTSSIDYGGQNGRLFLLRILFDIPANPGSPPGQTLPIPYPRIGATEPSPPSDHTLSPRFPWVLLDDVPIVDLMGVNLGGYPEHATTELPYFEKFGRLRARPFRPTDHLEAILTDFQASPQWLINRAYRIDGRPSDAAEYYQVSDSEQKRITDAPKEQVLAMLSSLYPEVLKVVPTDKGVAGFAVAADISKWDAVMADLKAHPVRWNPKTEEYERRERP